MEYGIELNNNMQWSEVIAYYKKLIKENEMLRLENDSLRDDIDNLKYELRKREDDLK